MVGERGPELFTPGVTGRVHTNRETQSMLAPQVSVAAPNVPITIVNVIDPREISDHMASAEGEKIIVNAIRRNRKVVKDAIA